MQAQEIAALIERALPGARAMIHSEDGVHFEAMVVSDAFHGQSLIAQHRLVYAALGERLAREEIHALTLKTWTPQVWQQRQGGTEEDNQA